MSGVNQKEYLKKYLSLGREPGQKKKRKKKPSAVLNRVKIIDDDVDVTFNEAVEEDLHGLIEDAPQIVGVIDDRPLELRISDYRDTDMWKPVGAEDSIRDNIAYNSSDNETHTNPGNSKNIQKTTQLTSNKYSDDYSPPRKRKESGNISKTKSNDKDYNKDRDRGRKHDRSPTHVSRRHDRRSSSESSNEGYKRRTNASPPRKGRNEGGDISPPRKDRKYESSPRRNKDNDSAQKRRDSGRSPAKKNKAGDDMSPPRKYSRDERNMSQNRHGSKLSPERRNSDRSPVRRNKGYDDMSPPRRYARDGDISPERRRRNKIDDNISPPRRNKRGKTPPRRNSDRSPVRRTPPTRVKRDRDISPERRSSDRSSERRNKTDTSPPRRNLKDYGDNRTVKNDGSASSRTRRNSDVSTSRIQRHDSNRSPSHSRRYNYEESRKSSSFGSGDYDKYKSSRGERRSRTESDRFGRDLSPTRSRYEKQEEDAATKFKAASGAPRKSRWDDETPSIERFLIPKKSGLQRANELIEQHDLFKDMAGPSAAIVAPIVRDRKTGKIRDFKKEEEEATMKQEQVDELKAKYDKWGKGLKQVEAATEKINEELHEMSKPLARYADDEDLEKHLKEMERDGDPMLDYLRKKKRRKDIEAGETFKPQFEGEFMPNRYGIRPGHRWDGVDRSNGYEKKWFEVMNSRRAQQEEAYKWSTEDM